MRPSAFHLTKQGASHIKKNKECQDASISFSTEDYAIAVVCDGHGGDDYVRSGTGANLASNIALQNIKAFIQDASKEELLSHYDKMLSTLEASIISSWSTAIYDDYEQNPFSDEELSVLSEKAKKRYLEGKIDSAYGTTLIAVVLTSDYWFGIHIGDGKCVGVNREGRFGQPIPWDPKCFLNATTSLCDSDALGNFRHFFSSKLPAAIFIGSDGIDDCFNSDQQLYNLYRTVLYSFATSDFESAKTDLLDYLPRLSAKGSGDDVSIAAVMDLDVIGELDTIKEYDREKEKAKVEERARKEAEKAAEEKKRIEAEYLEKKRQREEALRKEEEQRKKKRPPSRQKYCENCGALLHAGTKFCGECGSPVRVILAVPPKPLTLTEENGLDVVDEHSAENSAEEMKPTVSTDVVVHAEETVESQETPTETADTTDINSESEDETVPENDIGGSTEKSVIQVSDSQVETIPAATEKTTKAENESDAEKLLDAIEPFPDGISDECDDPQSHNDCDEKHAGESPAVDDQ